MSDEVAALREQLRAAEARADEYKAKLIAASQEIHNAQMAQAAAVSALALLREAVNANACTDDEHGVGCECRPTTIIERQQSALDRAAIARGELESALAEAREGEAQAMALVLGHEGRIAALTAERDEARDERDRADGALAERIRELEEQAKTLAALTAELAKEREDRAEIIAERLAATSAEMAALTAKRDRLIGKDGELFKVSQQLTEADSARVRAEAQRERLEAALRDLLNAADSVTTASLRQDDPIPASLIAAVGELRYVTDVRRAALAQTKEESR